MSENLADRTVPGSSETKVRQRKGNGRSIGTLYRETYSSDPDRRRQSPTRVSHPGSPRWVMTAVQNAYINTQTPMGATVINAGVTFRTWAPDARDVYLVTAADDTNGWSAWTPDAQNRLLPLGD